MAGEKVAIGALYTAGNGDEVRTFNDQDPSTSSSAAPAPQATPSASLNQDAPLPTYEESVESPAYTPHRQTSVSTNTSPPRPPPPQRSTTAALPMAVSTQPMPGYNRESTAVMFSAPVVTQPSTFVPIHGIPTLLEGNRQPPDAYFSTHPRPFQTGLCNCFLDCHVCCCSTFCSCCYLGALASKMGESCLAGICCLAGLAPLRTKLRHQHNIAGGVCDDVCLSTICCLCLVCQMGREMKMLEYGTKCCCC